VRGRGITWEMEPVGVDSVVIWVGGTLACDCARSIWLREPESPTRLGDVGSPLSEDGCNGSGCGESLSVDIGRAHTLNPSASCAKRMSRPSWSYRR
jgi:hypothetical protein